MLHLTEAFCFEGASILLGQKKKMDKPNNTQNNTIDSKDIDIDIENGGRRVSRNDRRSYTYTVYIPERRSGDDRRSGIDRRKAK